MVWNEGYISEINYTYGFYGELSPLKLALATAVNSVHPPDLNKPFNYCELGCGRGYTTNLLASAYPHAQFYANDFNPNHILEAKTLASSATNQNVHFFDDSFTKFIHQDLPQFDFIVLHGIYSWITPENRQAIVKFIDQKLTVGGLVYLSYNALPGWSVAIPIQGLMLRHRQQSSEPILESIEQALNFTGKLIDTKAGYFVQNPNLKNRYERLKLQNRYYLAHEYFNEQWNSFYFDQVVQELEEAKLNFIGSAQLTDYVDVLNLSQEAQKELNEIKDPIYKEVVRDFYLNTQFRRDIFARGKLPMTPVQQSELIRNIRYALIVPRNTVKLQQSFAVGNVTLHLDIYNPICDVLAESSLTMEELHNHPAINKITMNNLYQALIVLTGIGYVHPAVDDQICQQKKPFTDAFNNAVIKKAFVSDEMSYLASPLIGTGVVVTPMEQLLLFAQGMGEDAVKFVWNVLSSQNKKLMKDNQVLQTPEENIAHLENIAKEFYKNSVPTLKKLGI
ncbi:class I SAM-dependent methyltransferase [Geminocystis sp. GBBB08]|uniref:class I SAM-dependent methyltransferase n=1 Tax=Geminocystis sp. GBBB08 TaxID=2604140 RepID=UPI0027E39350|nr:class I SAM-dependent methyltransferase [Geminocystis sp. GBBB08]MBL1210761.1 methyltransferase domain-containing protein [Geminocystis sp. GBBB08]